MPIDPDGDSQMASSPESSISSPTGSRTPTNNPGLDDARASELSPPGSQTRNLPDITELVGLEKNGSAVGSSIQGSGQQQEDVQQQDEQQQQQQQQPGARWMNKRAEEEYQRAMEYVVDKDFNLDEFGDPFDERDMEEGVF